MTDPQIPQPSPYAPPPPAPPAPSAQPAAPAYEAPAYQAPGYQAPPGAYVAPIGGYSAPGGAYQAPQPPAPKRATMGIIAFALSLVAAVVAPIFGGIAGYQIGAALPALADNIDAATSDLSFLSPVRDQVLIGELGFWGGTLAGIAAIVFGIIAIAKRQGRAWGVVALILGVVAPVIFFTALSVMLGSGTSVGFLAQ